MTPSGRLRDGSAPGLALGYVSWGLAVAFFFYAWVLRVAPSVMVEQLMRDFAVSGAVLGNLSAIYFYLYAVLQMPVGMAHDRWGPRRVLSLATLLAGAGALIFAVAPTVEFAYLGRALVGAGAAFGFVGSMVIASAWFPPRRFALLAGLALAFGFLGGIGGQAPLAILVDLLGWRSCMLLLAVAAVGLSLAIWLLARDRPEGNLTPGSRGSAGYASILAALWRVARQPQTVATALFAGLLAAPTLAFGALWGVPYAMMAYGIGRPAAAFTMSFILLGWVAGSPFWGWLSDRLGLRKPPLIVAAVLSTVTLALALYLPDLSLEMFRVLLFLNGVGAAGMSVSFALAREQNAQSGTGAALGIVNMAAVAGGAIFQPIIGLLLDMQWDGASADGARLYSLAAYRSAFLVLPGLCALAAAATLVIRETRCQPVAAVPSASRDVGARGP